MTRSNVTVTNLAHRNAEKSMETFKYESKLDDNFVIYCKLAIDKLLKSGMRLIF